MKKRHKETRAKEEYFVEAYIFLSTDYDLVGQHIGASHGRHLALYHDRHGIFTQASRATQADTLQAQLAGKQVRKPRSDHPQNSRALLPKEV